jgi:hypothetical protein
VNPLVVISPRRVAIILAVVVVCLVPLSIVANYYQYVLNGQHEGLVSLFDFDSKLSIPAWFTVCNFLLAAILLAAIASVSKRVGDGWSRHWLVMSFIFLFLSLDQQAAIHTKLSRPLRDLFHTGGLFYAAWVIPYSILVIVFVLAYARFLLNLPPRTRNTMIIAGIIFVAGKIGVEMVDTRYLEAHGHDMTYALMTTLEAFLKMIGLVIFNYALLSYLSTHGKEIGVCFGDEG